MAARIVPDRAALEVAHRQRVQGGRVSTETINWQPVTTPPDSDITVMIFPDAGGDAWIGFLDGDVWRASDGMPVSPTHWAHMPCGPIKSIK